MKEQPRGPFSGIKWFCQRRPRAGAQGLRLRRQGPGLAARRVERQDAPDARPGLPGRQRCWPGSMSTRRWPTPGFADAYAQWLVEKFLIAADDGWILRKAQYYRGAVQEEDERETARRLLIGMAGQPAGSATASWRCARVRGCCRTAPTPRRRRRCATWPRRWPTATRASRSCGSRSTTAPRRPMPRRCAAWAANAKDPKLAEQARRAGGRDRSRLSRRGRSTQALDAAAKELAADAGAASRCCGGAHGLRCGPRCRAAPGGVGSAAARSCAMSLPQVAAGPRRLGVLDLSLAVEAEHFRAAAELRSADDKGATTSRAGMIARLKAGADAAYGTRPDRRPRARRAATRPGRRFAADEIPLGELPGGAALPGPVAGLGHADAAPAFRRGDGQARRRSSRWPSCSSRTSCAAARCWPIRRAGRAVARRQPRSPACSTGCSAATSAPASRAEPRAGARRAACRRPT